MNLLPVTAVLGFIWAEAKAVGPGIRSNENTPETFSITYYLKNNWGKLLWNALGTAIAYLMAPIVGVFLRYLISRLIEDQELIASISDYAFQPLVGVVIGLFGAKAIRALYDRGSKKLDGGSPPTP